MAATRILVVEDSLTVRRRIREVLEADGELQVIGEASDGKQAIDLCVRLRPDVITMDMMLPVMSGLGATEYIMAHCPTPILIVSSSTNRGELFKTYDALAAGAVDVLEKPGADDRNLDWERSLVASVKLVSRIPVVRHPRGRLGALGRSFAAPHAPKAREAGDVRACSVVAIGASTGGPAAIVEILRALSPSYSLPVLFVLHIGHPFATAFADWLDGQTALRVAFARDGDAVSERAGQVMMAPPDCHLVVRGGRLRLTLDPARHSCRPSIDVLFESVAAEYGPATTACLLTGMGRDGARGLLDVRRAGGFTLAQDETTSVVYGMPREAELLGAAERVLPLGEIGAALAALGQRAGG